MVESLRKSVDEADETKKKLEAIVRKTLPSVMNSIFKDSKEISSDGIKLFSTSMMRMLVKTTISHWARQRPRMIHIWFSLHLSEKVRVTCYHICRRSCKKKDQGRRYSPSAFTDTRWIRWRKCGHWSRRREI